MFEKKVFGKIKLIEKKQIIPYRMFYYQSLEFLKCAYLSKNMLKKIKLTFQ